MSEPKKTFVDPAPPKRGGFWVHKTVEQLAQEQGVKPMSNPKSYFGGWPDDIDDGFDEALAKLRSS